LRPGIRQLEEVLDDDEFNPAVNELGLANLSPVRGPVAIDHVQVEQTIGADNAQLFHGIEEGLAAQIVKANVIDGLNQDVAQGEDGAIAQQIATALSDSG
jgi:hypothetical protein